MPLELESEVRIKSEKIGYYKARQVAEKVLGRSLPTGVVIHHVDEDPTNNNNSNLVVCENQSYHFLLHRRMKALKACGHASWRKCQFCEEYDSLKNLYIAPNDRQSYHRSCHNQYQKEYSNAGIR